MVCKHLQHSSQFVLICYYRWKGILSCCSKGYTASPDFQCRRSPSQRKQTKNDTIYKNHDLRVLTDWWFSFHPDFFVYLFLLFRILDNLSVLISHSFLNDFKQVWIIMSVCTRV